MFQTPNGTFADETFHTARYLAPAGRPASAIIREDNPIGDEYVDFFRQHARRLGLNVASDQIISGHANRGDMRRAVSAIRDSGAESVMHLGYGLTFFEVLTVLPGAASSGPAGTAPGDDHDLGAGQRPAARRAAARTS